MPTQNKRLIIILLLATVLLLTPALAMQFTEEVKWSLLDFVVAGILLYGAGFLCEFIFRRIAKRKHQIALCSAIIAALILTWIELAVGIF
ncbi:MAG: hypothetical protein KGO81_02455 [Bacteroidota bacterium]|nr:hypothetical protein [Bacteroidota bacterium]